MNIMKSIRNPSTEHSDIRIVVVGDSETGKSSLIATIANAACPTVIPNVLPPSYLPADLYPDNVPLTVIDTSSRLEDRGKVVEELRAANVVVVTYACDEATTFNHLVMFWLPEIRRLQVRAPVIVVGCKLDLIDEDDRHLEQLVSPVMIKFREIETCIECSAVKELHVEDVFYYAQKAVIHPVGPVFNRETRTLTPRCQRALKRIFMISDHNQDGALDDSELNNFQVKCFDAPLHPAEIVGVKRVVRDKLPDGVNENGLTLKGFLFLHSLFVEKGRIETTWNVLRKFGYNDEIRLRDELLFMSFKRAPDQSVELTKDTLEFLKHIFCAYDAKNEQSLLLSELDGVFSTAPECPWNEEPYKDAVEKSSKGVSLRGFLSEWMLMTLLDPSHSLANLIYMGYTGDPHLTFKVTRKRSIDCRKRESHRFVFQCFVFGPKGSGKSSLLDSFLGRDFVEKSSSTAKDRYAANFVDLEGTEKILVMREIPEDNFRSFLSSKDSLAPCDVAIFVHDSSDENSWINASKMLTEVTMQGEVIGYGMPCLVIAAKSDLDSYPSTIHDSVEMCKEMGIQIPIAISIKNGDVNDVFTKIIRAAQCPHLGVPETEMGRRKKKYKRYIDHSLILLAFGAAVSGVGMAAYRAYTARKNTPSH